MPVNEPALWARARRVFWLTATATVAVVTVLIIVRALYLLVGLLTLILVALFIAVSLDPAVRWLTRRGFGRPWAVGLIATVMFATVAGFIAAVVPTMIDQGQNLINQLPDYLAQARDNSRTLRDLGDRLQVTDKVTAWAADLPAKVGASALAWGVNVLSALVSALLVAVLTVYFMLDLPRIRRGTVALFPAARRQAAGRAVNVIVDKVGAYMIGNLVISGIAGLTALPVLLLLKVPYAVVLAVVVAVTDLIPLIGALLGAAICTAVATLGVDLWPAGGLVALFFLLYQQLENYVIAPRVLRDAANLPAVAVLLIGLTGGALLGLVGILMAVPVAAAIKVLIDDHRERATALTDEADTTSS
ncbi:AI-2E family transporter [Longispora sp. NPDC051575]|uniref:AI-2E family transporter n=1 Tax=Longispora sp. NPDC051575 TaxID=3154943 RepID=UPI00341FB75F